MDDMNPSGMRCNMHAICMVWCDLYASGWWNREVIFRQDWLKVSTPRKPLLFEPLFKVVFWLAMSQISCFLTSPNHPNMMHVWMPYILAKWHDSDKYVRKSLHHVGWSGIWCVQTSTMSTYTCQILSSAIIFCGELVFSMKIWYNPDRTAFASPLCNGINIHGTSLEQTLT